MMKSNVLILSAGRRVELVQCFQQAALKLGIQSKVVAGDCSEWAPAIYFSDRHVRLPRISEPQYIEAIINVVRAEDIQLIVPTIDTDLLLLAENKARIEAETKAKLLISSLEVVSICRDKIKTQQFLEDNGFGVPRLYTAENLIQEELHFPLFIKPKNGSSSINAFKVNSKRELETYMALIPEPMVQDFMEGEEYSVDVFCDFEGRLITAVPRLRMATRSGEIAKGKIVKDAEILADIKRLVDTLKPIGHITVQLMKTQTGVQYIEINPRFGGGAPMSIKSGADSCENLYRLMEGESLAYNEDYRDQLVFLRYDSSICIDENKEIVE